MPANLTPEYKEAEAAYRSASDPKERLQHLREMLRTIPKHKGTDHLQADMVLPPTSPYVLNVPKSSMAKRVLDEWLLPPRCVFLIIISSPYSLLLVR